MAITKQSSWSYWFQKSSSLCQGYSTTLNTTSWKVLFLTPFQLSPLATQIPNSFTLQTSSYPSMKLLLWRASLMRCLRELPLVNVLLKSRKSNLPPDLKTSRRPKFCCKEGTQIGELISSDFTKKYCLSFSFHNKNCSKPSQGASSCQIRCWKRWEYTMHPNSDGVR